MTKQERRLWVGMLFAAYDQLGDVDLAVKDADSALKEYRRNMKGQDNDRNE